MRIAQTALDHAAAPVALLTTIPVARLRSQLPAASAGLFPVAGLFLGCIVFGLDYVAREVMPLEAASALVVVALVALTGALHLDGLADSADGLFAHERGRRLEIMRDPHNGAFGMSAVGSVLLLKFAALLSLEGGLRAGMLILAPCLARWSVLPVLLLFPSAREDGMGAEARRGTGVRHLLAGTVIAIAAAVLIFPPEGIVLLGTAFTLALAIGFFSISRIGGVTGDIFGATIEIIEATLLIAAATSMKHSWLT